MKVQRCKLFGCMLCLLVTARSYDWGGSGVIRVKASNRTHLNKTGLEWESWNKVNENNNKNFAAKELLC